MSINQPSHETRSQGLKSSPDEATSLAEIKGIDHLLVGLGRLNGLLPCIMYQEIYIACASGNRQSMRAWGVGPRV